MSTQRQSQLLNKCCTSYIGATPTINNHTTYLILDEASSMENSLPLLICLILMFDLGAQRTSNHKRLPSCCKLYPLIISSILQLWHVINIIHILTIRCQCTMLIHMHCPPIWALRCYMSIPQTFKTLDVTGPVGWCFVFRVRVRSGGWVLPRFWGF